MAERAVLREIHRDMIGNSGHRRGAGVVLRMAAITIGRKRSGVVVRVARCAGNRCVCAGQRERCGAVIKGRIEPGHCRVALRAVLRKTRIRVIWHACD